VRALDGRLLPDAILATNTSSLSIAAIAGDLPGRGRIVGMHFFNPPVAMPLIEIVRGEATTDDVVERTRALAVSLGKEPIVVRDMPGFATSRLGILLGLEAARMLEEGVASAADIDRAMELGYGHPMGPLKLGDLVGLDVRLAIAEHLEQELGPRYAAPQIMRDLVAQGHLGRKSGRGFHAYE
jgi:3-hydroxybutyryl-CoA dehydrogenase